MQEKNKRFPTLEDERFRKSLGLMMKVQREKLDLTQKEIADRTGIPLRRYISMESGSITSINLFRYLKVFPSFLEYPLEKILSKK